MDNNVTITANVISGSSSSPDVTSGATVQVNVTYGAPVSANVVTGGKGDKGDQGDQGIAATIEVGTVTTVDPSDPATVTNVGTEEEAIFDFEIPQGVDGLGVPDGGTTAQVLRKASNTDQDTEWHTPVKADVGLPNVDNTSDLNKPVSTATQTALDAKVTGPASVTDDLPAIFDGTTGKLIKSKTYAAFKTLLSLVKGDVGLGNVDNTSDVNKPVSTAQATADSLVASNAASALASHEADTTNVHGITDTSLIVKGPASVTDDLPVIFDGTTGKLVKSKTYAAFKTLLALAKGDVGLGNVDNVQQQPLDADLTTIAGLTATTDNFLQAKSSAWASRTPAQVLADLAAVGTTFQPLDSDLTTIAGLTPTTDNFMVATASAWASRTPSQARSQMGLGSIATLSTITEANITLADNTTNNFTTSAHGFVPKGTNTGKFLKDDGTWASIPGGGDALTSNPLSQFASTTSLQLLGVMSDETGTGSLVFATSPTLVTPVLGVATATSINKVALTAPATAATLTIANNKTLTVNNSLTLAGTDSTVMTFPGASDTIAGLAAIQTITGAWSFNDGKLILNGATSGNTTLKSGAAAGSSVITLPVATDTLVGKATTDTLTNKTVDSTSPTAFNPPGIIQPYAGRTAPSGWLLCDGSAVSRATYSALFAAICESVGTFTVTIATPAVVTQTAHGMVTGDQVYLTTTGALPTGLSQNTLYYVIRIDANSYNLATSRANAIAGTKIATSGTQSGVHTLRWCPYGLGDGSTTFTLPDLRGRVVAGADAMGGTAASRLTLSRSQGSYGQTGAVGGAEAHTLVTAELAAHSHVKADQFGTDGNAFADYGAWSKVGGSAAGGAGSTQNTGGDTAHNNVQPTLVANYMIKT